MSMPAKVTMKAGMPTKAIQKPCHTPTSAPMPSERMTESHHGRPHCTANTPEQAPTKAATDPTDRSMWPAMMTITMPIASTRMYPFCTTRFEMFCGRSRMPLVRIENSTTTAMSAMKMPFLPRSESTWLSRSVNLFSTGLTLPPASWVSSEVVGFGFDMVSPGVSASAG